MNVQRNLSSEFLLFKFKLGHKVEEVTKKNYWTKSEEAVKHCNVNR